MTDKPQSRFLDGGGTNDIAVGGGGGGGYGGGYGGYGGYGGGTGGGCDGYGCYGPVYVYQRQTTRAAGGGLGSLAALLPLAVLLPLALLALPVTVTLIPQGKRYLQGEVN